MEEAKREAYDVYQEPEIILGCVAYAEKAIPIWEKIKAYMQEEGVKMDVVWFSNYPALTRALKKGFVDIAWNTPLAYLQARKALDGKTKVLSMRDVDRDFHAVIFSKKESAVKSINDLNGKVLAVASRDSSHANILPRYYLRQLGIKLVDAVDQHLPIQGLRIAAFNTDIGKHGDTGTSEAAVIEAVLNGEADAGALGQSTYEAYVNAGQIDPFKFHVIWTSPAFNHCNFTAAADFSKEKSEKFVNALLAMDYKNPEHKMIMDLEGLKKWVPGTTDGYDELEKGAKAVGEL